MYACIYARMNEWRIKMKKKQVQPSATYTPTSPPQTTPYHRRPKHDPNWSCWSLRWWAWCAELRCPTSGLIMGHNDNKFTGILQLHLPPKTQSSIFFVFVFVLPPVLLSLVAVYPMTPYPPSTDEEDGRGRFQTTRSFTSFTHSSASKSKYSWTRWSLPSRG